MRTEAPSGPDPGSRTNTFIFAAHQAGDNDTQGMSCTVDRAEDGWRMLAALRSTQQRKVAGVGVAATPVEPIPVWLLVQRLKHACVTSADWERLCYSCWTMRTESRLLAVPFPARQVASAWLLLPSTGLTFLLQPVPTSDA